MNNIVGKCQLRWLDLGQEKRSGSALGLPPKKEVFSEAKAEGFDVKILREIIKLRKQDKDERDERDTLLDMYMRAMETAGPELAAKAA
jgi:hypothetical protein